MAESLVHEEGKDLTVSANPMALTRGIDKAIGDLIADAMEKVGKDGVITVEEANGVETTLDVVEGMQFDRGYLIGHSRDFPGLPGTFSASC